MLPGRRERRNRRSNGAETDTGRSMILTWLASVRRAQVRVAMKRTTTRIIYRRGRHTEASVFLMYPMTPWRWPRPATEQPLFSHRLEVKRTRIRTVLYHNRFGISHFLLTFIIGWDGLHKQNALWPLIWWFAMNVLGNCIGPGLQCRMFATFFRPVILSEGNGNSYTAFNNPYLARNYLNMYIVYCQ